MNIDGINRINFQRNLYKDSESVASTEESRELQKIKIELKIANDEKARESNLLNSVTDSPYLKDQVLFKKDIIFGTPRETEWKEVKSSDQVLNESRTEYLNSEIKKLNIL